MRRARSILNVYYYDVPGDKSGSVKHKTNNITPCQNGRLIVEKVNLLVGAVLALPPSKRTSDSPCNEVLSSVEEDDKVLRYPFRLL
jgi:hypothetical protein